MSKHWKEPLDPSRHLDFMSGAEVGGRPRKPPRDPLGEEWAYSVRVNGFTFEFASLDHVRECLAYCREKTHPARRQPGIDLEHYWQRWFERLPKGLLRGDKRERVVGALERALAEFEKGTES
ncbi:MAG: hypothetical protein OEY14_02800 [Myxococcales bacterium]|nr:hypothetical protein [Myxococcales bacterium]